jgi:hypothetical protein
MQAQPQYAISELPVLLVYPAIFEEALQRPIYERRSAPRPTGANVRNCCAIYVFETLEEEIALGQRKYRMLTQCLRAGDGRAEFEEPFTGLAHPTAK